MDPTRCLRRAFPVALALAMAGCGGNGSSPTSPSGGSTGGGGGGGGSGSAAGSFTATYTGDVSKQISGIAFFGEGDMPDTGQHAWVLYLSTGGQEDTTAVNEGLFFIRAGTRPDAGDLQLAAVASASDTLPTGATAAVSVLKNASGQQDVLLVSQSGTITFDNSSSSSVSGSFQITASGITGLAGGSLTPISGTITGTFTAVAGAFIDKSLSGGSPAVLPRGGRVARAGG